MSVISANISFKRGGHELLDFSSIHNTYNEALTWANNKNSNAALGQFIYIKSNWTDEHIPEKPVIYTAGPYVVSSIGQDGTGAVLTPLAKSIAGNPDITELVTNLNKEVTKLNAAVGEDKEADSTGIFKDIFDLNAAIGTKPVDGSLNGDGYKDIWTAIDTVNDKKPGHTYSLAGAGSDKPGIAFEYWLVEDGTKELKDNVISIPKDQFLKSANFIASATSEDKKIDDAVIVGQAYLKFVFYTKPENGGDYADKTVYVSVNDLVDVYTGGAYITISEKNEIAVNYASLSAQFIEDLTTDGGDGTISSKLKAYLKTYFDTLYATSRLEDEDIEAAIKAAAELPAGPTA